MNQELINYIRENLAKGMSENQIRQTLLKSGWQEADINAAFPQLEVPQGPLPSMFNNSQTPQAQWKFPLNPKILVVAFLAILLLVGGGVSAFLSVNKTKELVSKKEIREQRLVYAVKTGSSDDYLSDIEIYSVKLDGTDQKQIFKARKEDLVLLNSRLWPFYDALILRGEKKPFAIIDNLGNDLSEKYSPDNFEFGYFLENYAPSLSPSGKKIAFTVPGVIWTPESEFLYCQSDGKCPIHIRNLNTKQISQVEIKFDVWSYGEFLVVGWTDDENFIIGTGCNTTSCSIDGLEVHGTWALNLKNGQTKIYGEGGNPPFLLPGASKFVYSSYDSRCKGDRQYLLPQKCTLKLVDLEKGEEKTLAYNINKNAYLTPLRFVPKTGELFFLETPDFNPNSTDADPVKLIVFNFPLKSVKIELEEVETSTLSPVFHAESVLDLSMDGNYVVFQKRENGVNKIMSKNLKTGQEYEIAKEWSEYVGLMPENVKRTKTGLLRGPAINLSLPKLPVNSPTSAKTVDQPTQPTLEDCVVVQSGSLFSNTLTFKNADYSRQGQPIYNELNYVNGPDSIKLSVIKKGNNKELYETLIKSIQAPAFLGEGSEKVRKDLYGESVLFTVTKHTNEKYKWSIAVTIADDVIVFFQGPTKESKVEISSIEDLFNNWFQNVCGKM